MQGGPFYTDSSVLNQENSHNAKKKQLVMKTFCITLVTYFDRIPLSQAAFQDR